MVDVTIILYTNTACGGLGYVGTTLGFSEPRDRIEDVQVARSTTCPVDLRDALTRRDDFAWDGGRRLY